MAENNDNYIGLAMGLDVTDLKAGLTETKKEITTARKEFNATTAGMDDWSKSSEGLEAKLKELDTVLKNQKKNYNGIQAELDQAKQKYGENSEQVRKLNDRLLDAQTAIGKTEKAQRKYSDMLDKVESETKDTTKATGKMSKSLKEADSATGTLKGGFTVLKGAMANLVSSGIQSLVSGIQSVVSESREFRREMAYLKAGADDMGVSFEGVEKQLDKVTAITEDQGGAVEGLNNLLIAGFDTGALDQITNDLLGASIKWKDTLKFEGLADGLQETLATKNATGPFSEMLERAGVNLDKFNRGLRRSKTDAERQNYVMEELSKLGLSDVTNGYVEANKTLIEGAQANSEYEKAMANVGAKAEPILSSVKMGFANVLMAMMGTSEGMETSDIQGKIADAFQWFIEECVPFLKDAMAWIIDHFKEIAVVVGIVGGAFVAWKVAEAVGKVVKAVKTLRTAMRSLNLEVVKNTANWVKNTASMVAHKVATVASRVATKAMTTAQKLLNLAMRANPIGIVITAIMLLVTAFVTLWKKSDSFRKFWIGIWEKITKVAKDAWKAITGFFTGAWKTIKGAWDGVKDFFKGIFDKIVNVFTDLPDKLKDIGSRMMEGLIDGVKSMANRVKNAVKDTVDSAVKGVKDFLGIHSPSRLMRDEIGEMMGLGVGEGILASTKTVVKDAQGFASKISTGLTKSVGGIKPTISAGGLGGSGGTVINNNYVQTINAPKQPSRLELYRQSKNLLNLKGGY